MNPKDRQAPVLRGSAASEDLFAKLEALLNKWYYKPDLQAIRIVLGAINAHYLKIGDPAWLFLIGPPGSGKTTITIFGASGLPQVQLIGDLSENTLLSGFYGKQKPGLLEKLGKTARHGDTYTTQGDGIFLVKDFTTVLSMRREKRAAILAQLREIHDGEFKRDFGTGQSKIWRGRLSTIAAVTPAIDRHYSVFTTLGERFLQLRWSRPDSEVAGEWAIDQQGKEGNIRREAKAIVGKIFAGAEKTPPELSGEMKTRLAALAEVAAIARTHVYRDSYGSREIEYVPEPEANTRIAKGLAALARGLASLNGRKEVSEQDLQDVMRVGLDCVSDTRRKLLIKIATGGKPDDRDPARTVRQRQLEELEALGVLSRTTVLGQDDWSLTKRVSDLLLKANASIL